MGPGRRTLLHVRLSVGLGGKGRAAVAVLLKPRLHRRLELDNVAFCIPGIQCGVAAEVPSSAVGLEEAACCMSHCFRLNEWLGGFVAKPVRKTSFYYLVRKW
jgi:hypothetical protein